MQAYLSQKRHEREKDETKRNTEKKERAELQTRRHRLSLSGVSG